MKRQSFSNFPPGRKIKSYNKKGILFTVGLTALTLVILAAAILIFHNAQISEGIAAKLAAIDRVYDLDISIQRSIKDLFNLKSGISINITETSISFEEEFPNPNAESFNNSMKSFKHFIESNFSNINITIDEMINQLPLTIMPKDITYKHINFGDRIIEVIPQQINFGGYSVFMSIDENVTSCVTDLDNGGFNFSAEVTGANGDDCSYSAQIEPSGENKIDINGGEILIEVNNNIFSITIEETSEIDAYIRTTIETSSTSGAYVEYSSPSTAISFGELGVSKESKTRLT